MKPRSIRLLLFAAFIAVFGPGHAQVPPPPAASQAPPSAEILQSGIGVTAQFPSAAASPAPDTGAGDASAPATDVTPAAGPANPALPHDLSPWGMFMAADWIVKGVMLGLAFASVVTWTVWLAKSMELAASTLRLRRAAGELAQTASLDAAAAEVGSRQGPAADMVRSSAAEIDLSHGTGAGLKERVASRLERIEVAAGRRMMRGTGVLATIGSTAPFVGLFGTVWGIMNAFVGISKAQTTNLAVVAPGIAEALLATAIGLVAAIPAVIIYNIFARSISGYRVLLTDVSAEVQRLVSRDLDRMRQAPLRAAE